ncbi:hypothetical protein SAMN05216383_108112 [Prevotella sp. KH2C16]|nr:hypothetical protein SAMN05216383_108112 [Prevotella sp. KH2C16]
MGRVRYFLIFILFCGCSNPISLIDYYWVYPEDEFGNGYYLICKLSSDSANYFMDSFHTLHVFYGKGAYRFDGEILLFCILYCGIHQ